MPEQLSFEQTVDALRDPHRPRHFLAMDQSEGTHRKHMKQFGVEPKDEADFQEKAKAARVMLSTSPDLKKYFGGVIVHDDLFSLEDFSGKPLHQAMEEQGVIVIGKKLGLSKDTGLATELETLPEEMERLVGIGVHAVKTRTTATYGSQSRLADEAAEQMMEVQRLAAKNGKIAAVLEPEFIKDNSGSLQENTTLMIRLLKRMMDKIESEGLRNHPFFLKTSFPTPGSESGEPIDPAASAEAFKQILEAVKFPDDLLIVFLSGGHSSETSRMLLQAMAKVRVFVGSSFSRANVERPYQRAFSGGSLDIRAGQDAIALEGLKNQLALEGRYHPRLEEAANIEEALRMAQ